MGATLEHQRPVFISSGLNHFFFFCKARETRRGELEVNVIDCVSKPSNVSLSTEGMFVFSIDINSGVTPWWTSPRTTSAPLGSVETNILECLSGFLQEKCLD